MEDLFQEASPIPIKWAFLDDFSSDSCISHETALELTCPPVMRKSDFFLIQLGCSAGLCRHPARTTRRRRGNWCHFPSARCKPFVALCRPCTLSCRDVVNQATTNAALPKMYYDFRQCPAVGSGPRTKKSPALIADTKMSTSNWSFVNLSVSLITVQSCEHVQRAWRSDVALNASK